MAFSSNERTIKSDLDAISTDLARFKEEFRSQVGHELRDVEGAAREFGLMPEDELKELAARIEQLVEQLQDMITELRDREHHVLSTAEAVQMTATVNTLQAEVDALLALLTRIEEELAQMGASNQAFISKVRGTARRAITSLRTLIKPVIQRIAQRLWRLIASLITPKEWSIGGELGNTVWGLTKVKLEIKFGP